MRRDRAIIARTQVHQSYLSQWTNAFRQPLSNANRKRRTGAAGDGAVTVHAIAVGNAFHIQAAVLAYADIFMYAATVAFVMIPVGFLVSSRRGSVSGLLITALAINRALSSLAFGLSLWIFGGLAVDVAFWLELGNPFWASISASIVSQRLGAALRKGSAALAIVVGAASTSVRPVAAAVIGITYPPALGTDLAESAPTGEGTSTRRLGGRCPRPALGNPERDITPKLDRGVDLDLGLAAVARNGTSAVARPARLDATLAAHGSAGPLTQTVLRARGTISVQSEVLGPNTNGCNGGAHDEIHRN